MAAAMTAEGGSDDSGQDGAEVACTFSAPRTAACISLKSSAAVRADFSRLIAALISKSAAPKPHSMFTKARQRQWRQQRQQRQHPHQDWHWQRHWQQQQQQWPQTSSSSSSSSSSNDSAGSSSGGGGDGSGGNAHV